MKIASAPQDRSAGRILAIASGKGGVGKTMLSIGMARAFSQMGERCLLMDGDLGMANIDVQLGLQPNSDISSVINGRVKIQDAVCPAMGGASQKGGFDVNFRPLRFRCPGQSGRSRPDQARHRRRGPGPVL